MLVTLLGVWLEGSDGRTNVPKPKKLPRLALLPRPKKDAAAPRRSSWCLLSRWCASPSPRPKKDSDRRLDVWWWWSVRCVCASLPTPRMEATTLRGRERERDRDREDLWWWWPDLERR